MFHNMEVTRDVGKTDSIDTLEASAKTETLISTNSLSEAETPGDHCSEYEHQTYDEYDPYFLERINGIAEHTYGMEKVVPYSNFQKEATVLYQKLDEPSYFVEVKEFATQDKASSSSSIKRIDAMFHNIEVTSDVGKTDSIDTLEASDKTETLISTNSLSEAEPPGDHCSEYEHQTYDEYDPYFLERIHGTAEESYDIEKTDEPSYFVEVKEFATQDIEQLQTAEIVKYQENSEP